MVMDVEHGVPLLLSASGTAIWDAVVDGRGPFEDLNSCPPRPEMDIITDVAQSASGDVAEVAEDVITFLEDLVAHHVVNRR
ncbi:Coenzyme PQQ synthesis protein D (PqqD) [Micrococcus luteus]|uniref:Coenzyme PQQ synthesis protein D (PqqD) n=1 Tax=Micrococcus luteus TaxID=1270 RepID=A0ABD7M5H3_MICLU|nr:Coenzyme PQQ synthesis protein D (PqqD) [Micrococcus luteus]